MLLRYPPITILQAVGVLLLQGCAVGNNYNPPELPGKQNWVALKEDNSEIRPALSQMALSQDDNSNQVSLLTNDNINFISALDDSSNEVSLSIEAEIKPWWELFNDNTLSMLIAEGQASSNDIKAAAARIEEARANEKATTSGLFPQIDITAAARRETVGGSFGNTLNNSSERALRGNLNLDLFGATKRNLEAAVAVIQQSEAEEEQTRLTLIRDIARNYISLRGLQQQRLITVRNMQVQQDTLEITQGQRDEKIASELDVLRAEAQFKNTEARLPQIDAQIFAAMNRLAALTNSKIETVQCLLSEPAVIPQEPLQALANTNIANIANRPDIKAAERRLARASALSAAAFADFFPKISLAGLFGRNESSLFNGISPWNIGVNGILPLIDFGRIQAEVSAADARQTQAYFNYQQQVLQAVAEVETNLSDYLHEKKRAVYLAEIANKRTQAVTIAREQYLVGVAPQLDLLFAERDALEAENDLAIAKTTAADNLVKIYSSLGMETKASTTLAVGSVVCQSSLNAR